MALRMESVDLVLYNLPEKVLFVDFPIWEQVFWFSNGIPSQKSENYEPP